VGRSGRCLWGGVGLGQPHTCDSPRWGPHTCDSPRWGPHTCDSPRWGPPRSQHGGLRQWHRQQGLSRSEPSRRAKPPALPSAPAHSRVFNAGPPSSQPPAAVAGSGKGCAQQLGPARSRGASRGWSHAKGDGKGPAVPGGGLGMVLSRARARRTGRGRWSSTPRSQTP